jgi:hypothetical protein
VPAPPPTANEARFERSLQAAAQRQAKSLAAVDSMAADAAGAAGMRQIGPRQFVQQGAVWTDQQYSRKQRLVQVKAFSPLYFELVEKLSGLKEVLTLGEEVLVAGKGVAIQIGPSGLERMTAQQLADLVKVW